MRSKKTTLTEQSSIYFLYAERRCKYKAHLYSLPRGQQLSYADWYAWRATQFTIHPNQHRHSHSSFQPYGQTQEDEDTTSKTQQHRAIIVKFKQGTYIHNPYNTSFKLKKAFSFGGFGLDWILMTTYAKQRQV